MVCLGKIASAALTEKALKPHWESVTPTGTKVLTIKRNTPPKKSLKKPWCVAITAPSTRLDPITTSNPCSSSFAEASADDPLLIFIGGSKNGKNFPISSTLVELSASMNSRTSPVACSIPCLVTQPLPWFSWFAITDKLGIWFLRPSTTLTVSSLEPSLTTSISLWYGCFFKNSLTESNV